SGEMPMECRPISSWLQSITWNLRYIGSSRIEIGDSPPCCRWNLCMPSLLLHIGEPTTVHRYHLAARRCFI
ncbi:hypothetical protein HAX54_052886, partial [Datura stramonium]|nr:hypothetical protein [Datura stramonium]